MKLEFKPVEQPNKLKAGTVKDTGGDRTITLLLGAAALCVVGALILRSVQPAPPPPLEAPTPPPTPAPTAAYVSPLTDQQIDLTNWSDNPGELAKQLTFAAVFWHADPAFRRAQFRNDFLAEGAKVGANDEFTIVRIDPHVVFLRDSKDKLHRLIEPGAWNSSIEKYHWGGASRPPDPPARTSGPDDE
ncbi:MAG: hypothetical protein AB7K09_04070 [Planctomycetota bacterium]